MLFTCFVCNIESGQFKLRLGKLTLVPQCENYELSFMNQRRQSINQGWFGGQVLSIVGECHCRRMFQIWDRQELQCAVWDLEDIGTFKTFIFTGCKIQVSGWLSSSGDWSDYEHDLV